MQRALGLLIAMTVACATGTRDDRKEPSGGGGTNTGGHASGGDGGSTSACANDCSLVETPPCYVSVCNDGAHAGPVGSCVVVTGEDGTACDDGQFCTTNDGCQAGMCVGGPQNNCGITPEPCTEIACNEASDSCTSQPSANGAVCVPTDLCQLGATCSNGQCIGATVNDCFLEPVPDECHVSVCQPATGLCEPEIGNEGGPCVDQTDLCSVGNSCTAGVCGGGIPKDCSQLTQGCVLGVCNPANGACTTQNLMNGDLCDDLNYCTTGEICQNGGCANGIPVTTCVAGDNCCPSNCDVTNDIDCDLMPASYGNFTPFVDASSHSPDYLLGGKITLPVPAQLTHLAVITKGAGPNMKLALYNDLGGIPYSLIASTVATPMVLGTMEIPVTNVMLPAGDYWFMGVFSQLASIGISFANMNEVVQYISLPFGQPIPTIFPAPTSYNGQAFNYYIKVLE